MLQVPEVANLRTWKKNVKITNKKKILKKFIIFNEDKNIFVRAELEISGRIVYS